MEEDADALPVFFGVAGGRQEEGQRRRRPEAPAIPGRLPRRGQRGADPDAPRGGADVAQGSRRPQGARGVAQDALRRPPGLPGGRREVPDRIGAGPLRGRRPDRALAALHARRDLLHARPRRGPARRDEARARRDASRGRRARSFRSRWSRPRKPSWSCRRTHFLRRKVEDPKTLVALAETDPAETVRQLLASFGGRSTVQEVRDHSRGPGARRAVVRVLVGRAQAQAAPGLGQRQVGRGGLERERRRRRGQRAPGLREGGAGRRRSSSRGSTRSAPRLWRPSMAESLAAEARRAAGGSPALAWELSQAAARLAPGRAGSVSGRGASRGRPTCAGCSPRSGTTRRREKALEAVRASRPDWAEIFIEQISREEDARVLASSSPRSGTGPPTSRRKILRSPRTAPRAFVWLLERMHAEGRADSTALFVALTDALRMDEFSSLRARLKELFEPGGLAVALVRLAASEEEARDLLHALDRVAGLEEHRRATVREALLMKFPELRAPGARVPLRDRGLDRGAAPGDAAPEAGRASGQRRGHEDGEGARRPPRELRVPRRAAEARVPLGAHRHPRRRALADPHPRSDADRHDARCASARACACAATAARSATS